MSDERRPYAADEQDPFSWIDDELEDERPAEEEILSAEDRPSVDRHGTTPAEERQGLPVAEELAEEVPDERAEPDSEQWEEAPDPRADTLVDGWDVYAEPSRAPVEEPVPDPEDRRLPARGRTVTRPALRDAERRRPDRPRQGCPIMILCPTEGQLPAPTSGPSACRR